MKKHTNIDHEITGDYYAKDKTDWALVIINLAVGLGVAFIIAEFTGLTDWFISLWG